MSDWIIAVIFNIGIVALVAFLYMNDNKKREEERKRKEAEERKIRDAVEFAREQWNKVDKNKFLNLLADFYKESHFHDFFKAHQEFYQKTGNNYENYTCCPG